MDARVKRTLVYMYVMQSFTLPFLARHATRGGALSDETTKSCVGDCSVTGYLEFAV